MPFFLVVLNYQEAVTPAAKLELLVRHQGSLYLFNLLAYIVFGLVLTMLALALYERLSGETPALARVIAGWGIIWSSLLIASGAIANMGMEYVQILWFAWLGILLLRTRQEPALRAEAAPSAQLAG